MQRTGQWVIRGVVQKESGQEPNTEKHFWGNSGVVPGASAGQGELIHG